MDEATIKYGLQSIPAITYLEADIPLDFVKRINEHINKVIMKKRDDYSHELVGQIKTNKARSAQYGFDLTTDFGVEFKHMLDHCANTYIQNAYPQKKGYADCFSCWTVHSFAGDYNPIHSHGVKTLGGVSCIVYLEVPKSIANKPMNTGQVELKHNSGYSDGMTHLIWGVSTSDDWRRLKYPTETFYQPKVGRAIFFPHWLQHSVFPHYSRQERRTLSANFNVFFEEDINNG